MDLIPINNSKLKIMLDENDMKEYNIGDEADCANSATRLAIRHILDRAKDQIGFNTEGAEIFVQLYTSKSGGCELFVTKSDYPQIKEDKKTKNAKKSTGNKECQALAVRGETQLVSGKNDFGRMVFSFDTLRELCTACKILLKKAILIQSRAYRIGNSEFYLVLENTNTSAYTRLDKLTFLLEFGNRERADHAITYLNEHASPICETDAISTLADF